MFFESFSQRICRAWLTMIFFGAIFPAHAAVYIWDANGNASPNPSDGSGNWGQSSRWWNGSASRTWSDGNDAVFGSGVAGIYFVTNNLSLAQPVSLTFNYPGSYIIKMDNSHAGQLSWTAPGAGIGNTSKGLWVDTNVSAQIDVPWRNANGSDIFLGSNSVLTISQSNFGNQGTVVLKGSGAAISTVNATNGAWNGLGGTVDISGVTLNIVGSAVVNAGTRLDIGRPATGALASDGVINVSDGGHFNANSSSSTDPNANLQISRGGPGILNILPNGSVSTLCDGNSGRLLLIPDSSSQATVNVLGGSLNVGLGPNGAMGVGSAKLNLIMLMGGSMSYGGSASAIFNLSGGTVSARGIQIGSASGTFSSNPTNQINVTGGTLYLGAAGINMPKSTGSRFALNLSGGTIAAIADWSSACNAPINLTNVNGDITFQAADANDTPFDMSIASALTGVGGFKKTGGGLLTLTGTNTYIGSTLVEDGMVVLSDNGTAVASSDYSITEGGALVLLNSASANKTDRINNSASIIMDGGEFGFVNDASAASFGEIAGPLIINSGENVVTVYPATNGQSSALAFSSLTHNGGSVDFKMSTAGTSQNRVLFDTTPTLDNWITVNGKPATYDSINGLQEATVYVDIAARGSTIPNTPGADVRINSAGVGGNIQLESGTTAINSLEQNITMPAIVDLTANTLRVNQISINAGAQPLTIGMSPGDGIVTATSIGGNLTLANNSTFAPGLVINASVQDYGLPSSLTILCNGLVTLAAPNNSFSGGLTISNGTLAVTAGTMAAMSYTNFAGTLAVKAGAAETSLSADAFVFGSGPQLAFDLDGHVGSAASALIDVAGDVTLNGDVLVNVTNPVPGTTVLFRYAGVRIGSGRFKSGDMPAGAGIIDDPVSKQVSVVYFSGPTVVVPTHNANAIVVASAIPQQFGAVGDGVTDDSAAFQNALNAVNNSGGVGGGVLYVPSGVYAFSNSITIPSGVTLQGDWTDWSKGTNGVVGTLFKVYAGAGQSNGTPFITMNRSALKGVSIWYPNQDPANIVPYPFTISFAGDPVVQDVALINSYQGIIGVFADKHIIASVIGSPLYTGIQVDEEYDISQQEDIHFSPDVWTASKLPGAPLENGPHATWMRQNGVAERLYHCDGEGCMNVFISGYKVGIYNLLGANGSAAASFYNVVVTSCGTAFMDAAGGGNTGIEFTLCTLDGDVAVDREINNDASAYFHTCKLVGRNGTAIRQTGGNSSTMQFQGCDISGTVKVDGGIANFVNCEFTVPAGNNHCEMASGAIYAAFTGCIFNPSRQIVNAADPRRLVIDGRRASTSKLPVVDWIDIKNDLLARRPAKLDLFNATMSPWNAVGNGIADDTVAIQNALNAAGANGGGIVYLPPGKYKTSDTLDIPGGVELRGSFPSRHTPSLYDGNVKVTVIQPYGGAGSTNGPPAIALEPNAGVVGLTVTYELQDTNITPYPPTIQGRGANVYAYGIMCPNAYWYVDLNTYTCTNHLFYNVDGWALKNAFIIGNGSSGSIIECMANWSYWVNNNLSASQLSGAWQPPVKDFAEHNLDWFVLGDCTELMVKNFDYLCRVFMRCVSQNGRGPWITGILTQIDAAVECFRFEAAAPCHIDIVNPEWMVTLSDYSDQSGYGVFSTPEFQGTARFFNAPLWGSREWDYVIQGGDIGFEITHAGYLSSNGSRVDGGTVHFINCGFEGNTGSFYTIPFNSTSSGVPGMISEIIGCYAWTGVTNSLVNAENPVNMWGNFGINRLVTQTPFEVSPPELLFTADSQNVTLAWTNSMGAFNLYSADDLSTSTAWTPVSAVPYFDSGYWTVGDSATNSARFYKLRQ